MSDYSKEIFLKLNPDRQVKVSLDLVYNLEKCWDQESQRNDGTQRIIRYLSWMSAEGLQEGLRTSHLINSIKKNVSLRKILNIAIALERYLNLSLRDESIIISKGDQIARVNPKIPLYVVLDNLRSAFNVGSIFRTAECLGVSHIYLVGYSPTPDDKPVQKTAMGTDQLVSWSSVEKMEDVISELRTKNIRMVAMETSNQSKNLFEAKMSPGLALFFGNERFGLEAEVLSQMDQVLEIPMAGCKNSLNVGSAFAISAAETLRGWREQAHV